MEGEKVSVPEAQEDAPVRMRLPLWKKVLFSLIPLLAILLVGEVGLRLAHYQFTSRHSFAVGHAMEWVTRKARIKQAKEFQASFGVSLDDVYENLYKGEIGAGLLDELRTRYEELFGNLVQESKAIQAKLLIVFFPTPNDVDPAATAEYFRGLAKKHDLPFVDLGEDLEKHAQDRVYLLPENGHASRFGNMVAAARLQKEIEGFGDYRSPHRFAERPELFGDMRPNAHEVSLEHDVLAYMLVTNKQGLRMNEDILFPKTKQRILFLGDSFTFAPYLPNEHTIPGLLTKSVPQKEFVNGGKYGYTILDEATLLAERAKYVEPDIIVLQVLENDFYGLMSLKLAAFSRVRQEHQPTKKERAFLDALRKSAQPQN